MKPFFLIVLITVIYILSIIKIIFPLVPKGAPFYKNEGIFLKKDYIYTVKNNQRFYYYNFMDDVVAISDVHYPDALEIIFSDDKDSELEIVKSILILQDIIRVDFQKKEIICYNKISIKFYEKADLKKYFEKNTLENLSKGNYTLINSELFKE
ncbi:hypothetical protein C7380_101154 [Oceanotoga teriensis]|uniref:Uncharacterized protein n=1 Tax=Oceanotoga teriensis TaxID=515440 RepID=A0AA45C952_9BACT|nr:hypothetical protein [Oceanotoga teriensis]PWJ96581.1 hypothetical protein C7380_101154 [Oceanotoga teriensis]